VKWLSHNPFHRQAIFISTVFHNGSKSAKVHSTKEWISLRCETEQGATGDKYTTGTMAMYSGPDERLIGEEGWTIDGGDLSLADVVPIFREWGYVYEVAGFERP
jgi:hypothetical protein